SSFFFILLLFFFFLFSTLRVLLSFPTRRSSDLTRYMLHYPPFCSSNAEIEFPINMKTAILGVLTACSWVVFMMFLEDLHQDQAADRKSTRLNSSHVKISYAVFCLKKKKTKKEKE